MDLLRCERILDKLKLVNYEKKFLPKYRNVGVRALGRHYFAVERVKSSTSQFYTFACVATWLCEECGRPMEIPDENDDPEEIVSNLVQEAETLGVNLNIASPLEMLSGNGPAVLELLEGLCDAAVKKKGGFKPEIGYPEAEDEQQVVNEESRSRSNSASESIGSIIDEVETKKKSKRKPYMMKNTGFDSETEDEEEVADLDYVLNREDSNLRKKSKKNGGSKNYEEWLDEVDRVANNLKVVARLESKDWRARLDQISTHHKSVEKALHTTKPRLDRLEKNLSKALDTVESRQKYMNSNLESLLGDLRSAQDNLAERESSYEKVSGGLSRKTEELGQTTNNLDQVKRAMEERGTSMTDGAPLVKLKQALNRVTQEISDMRLQSAVLEHQLTQMRMHKKSTLARDMSLSQTAVN